MMNARILMSIMLGLLFSAAVAGAEGTRGSIAGVLVEPFDDYTFRSTGNEVLFADLDADVFQTFGRSQEEGHEESTHDSGGDGCAGAGGPGEFCLQVLNMSSELVCWAERPLRPGWQRDPNLACPIPDSRRPEEYVLRVFRAGGHETTCTTEVYHAPKEGKVFPYLLNVRLMRIPPKGSLNRAAAISGGP